MHQNILPMQKTSTGEGRATAKSSPEVVKNIVFVHGVFTDGSSWSKVIPPLLSKGYNVTSVQNPLTSFQDDVAATKRALAPQDGQVILVGHSYGGVVIAEAGNDPKVAGLVYVAAFAPDAGQNIVDLSATFPKPLGLDKVVPQLDGFLLMSPNGIDAGFAQDSAKKRALLFAVQTQTSASIFGAKPSAAAWRTKPSWYIAATNDNMIAPEQELGMAKIINATTITVPSSHVVMLTHPAEVVQTIEDAATRSTSIGEKA